MFLVYVSQPVLAMPSDTMMEMICCTEAERNIVQDMPCCDESMMDMENCGMDSCPCPIVISISVFSPASFKETLFFASDAEHRFPLLVSNRQTPLFPVWTPPDIA